MSALAALFAPGHHVLEPRGPQAAQIEGLWWIILAVTTATTLLVLGALTLSVRSRRREAEQPLEEPALRATTLPKSAPPARRLRLLERDAEHRRHRQIVAATVLSALVLLALLVASVRAGSALSRLSRDNPLHIELTAAQWWWKVRYLDEDAARIFVTANELHIPVGRPVSIRLLSADVIHSFWVPSLHGKRDIIPGHESSLWLRADAPGEYRGECAEFCGLQHANMALTVVAEAPADFERWAEAQRTPPRAPVSEQEKRGQALFLRGPCATCHSVLGTPAFGSNGPELSHFRSRTTLGAGARPNTRGHLAGWIVNSQALKPGSQMPSITLSGADLQALLAYLETLR